MAHRVTFSQPIQVTEIEGTTFRAVVPAPGWLARLSRAKPGNRLKVFYYRTHIVSDGGDIPVEDGVYEAEFPDTMGPHLIAFEVRGGKLGWTTSITLSKRSSMKRIADALASDVR